MQELPAAVGTELANWNWKVVSQYASERFGISLSRSTCLNYLHRLGFVLKHPKKRLVKADDTKRESFVADYAAPWDEAHRSGAKIFFAYEAHFRADAELRGKWVLKGEPAPVFTGAGFGGLQQPALWREGQLLLGGLPGDRRGGVDGTGGEQQLRNIGRVPEAIEREALWDNAPAHRGEAVREYLRAPGLALRLMNPRFHEGRLCRVTARTSTPMRRSGAGRGRRRPGTYAWEARPWYRRGSAGSFQNWPDGNTR